MNLPSTLDLPKWLAQNSRNLKPPVSNKQLFAGAQDVILFISGGPNTRNDFHVNPTEELFYQLKGDIALRVRPLDGSKPHDVIIREGELYLLPRWVPHRPQRPAGTLGMIVEFPRPDGQMDALRWYCPKCDALVHEAAWRLRKIDQDLKIIMEEFWGGPEKRRTCGSCGTVIQRGAAIELKSGRVREAAAKSRKPAGKKVAKKAGRKRPVGSRR